MRNTLIQAVCVCATVGLFTLVSGCQTNFQSSAQPSAALAQPTASPAATAPAPGIAQGVIRIKAGSTWPLTDSSGHVWRAEEGFSGGDTIARDAGTVIANTKDPGLFLSEHYSMVSFSSGVQNPEINAIELIAQK